MAKGTKTKSDKTASGGMSATKRDRLADKTFAFPKERKEPLNDAKHVRNAISRFNQVEDVSDRERDAAWRRIKKAAKKFDVEVSEKSWRDVGKTKAKKTSGKRKGAS